MLEMKMAGPPAQQQVSHDRRRDLMNANDFHHARLQRQGLITSLLEFECGKKWG